MAGSMRKNRPGLRGWGTILFCVCLLYMVPAGAEDVPELLDPVGVQMDTATAYIGEFYQIDLHNASVRPQVETLYFPLNGTVGEVHVVIGQQVKAGDPLITLNQDSQEERKENLEKQLTQLETNADFAKKMEEIQMNILLVELNQLLNQQGKNADVVALKQLAIEEAKINQALNEELRSRNIEKIRAELEKLQEESAERVLYAPCDGRIMYGMEMQRGTYIQAYNPILYMAIDNELFIETDDYISASYLDTAHEIYALIGEKKYALERVKMDQKDYISLVLSGETVKSQFMILDPDDAFSIGQYAAVCLVSDYVQEALIIPSNALYSDDSGRYVYVIEDEKRIRKTVKVGLMSDWQIQILDGLEEGAVVYVKE